MVITIGSMTGKFHKQEGNYKISEYRNLKTTRDKGEAVRNNDAYVQVKELVEFMCLFPEYILASLNRHENTQDYLIRIIFLV
jgi:hypothetical protein